MQTAAYDCPADILFYGGQAGGGKTDLLLGLGITQHYNSAIWRREYAQLQAIIERGHKILNSEVTKKMGAKASWRGAPPFIGWRLYGDGRRINLGGMQHEDDKKNWQGHPHDLKGFDEITQFTRTQFWYVNGWLRSDRPNIRKRIVACGNPPQDPDGQWVIEEWAAWLSESYPNPAKPGELRFYVRFDDKPELAVEVPNKEPITYKGTIYYPQSKTFLPSGLDDNPWYDGGEYRSALQSMPEPLRSQLLYGDFKAGLRDGAWQGIPTTWVRAAQQRWKQMVAQGHPRSSTTAQQIGVDVSRGGKDRTVFSPRDGAFFYQQTPKEGRLMEDGYAAAQALIQVGITKQTTVVIDVTNIGAAAYDVIKKIVHAVPFNGTEATKQRDARNLLSFYNKRALWHWRMREALDPSYDASRPPIALPDDPELMGDLCAWQWSLERTGIKVEDKEEIKKRLGRSPDKGEACIYANVPSSPIDLSLAVVGGSLVQAAGHLSGDSAIQNSDSPWNMGR